MSSCLGDPPKSPLKKGDFEYGSPLNKGGWGGSNILRKTLKTHPSPPSEGLLAWGEQNSQSPPSEGLLAWGI
ncbi:hypothetical protein LYNGBM3L_55580 [Moorena producens 3L]|uniref:Uncharacterized protein n=1 Tax=Moorena producens 3L TaxID=489825 RepID=F4XQZ3_9CYAN|nr:hypothetical protein LYNGBM3L_55580 [Moorena producens 3L]OLT64520.1 hypothetical protein BI334_05330 [Moorena producens 3L]